MSLERVAHGVADDGGGVDFVALGRAFDAALFDVLLAVVPRAAGVAGEDGDHDRAERGADDEPPTNSGPAMKPHTTGTTMASSAGTFISPMAPLVEMEMQVL